MRNEQLNNTCILFDKDNIAQQEAAIKYYNDNGWESDPNIGKLSDEYCIGVRDGKLDYWWQGAYLRIIDLPKEYYSEKIDNIVEDVKSEQTETKLICCEINCTKDAVFHIQDIGIGKKYEDYTLCCESHLSEMIGVNTLHQVYRINPHK